MTQDQAFLRQARSDFAVYRQLPALRVPRCHELHYLQMAAEKLAKAAVLRGDLTTTHTLTARSSGSSG